MKPFRRPAARKLAAIVLGLVMLVILVLSIERFSKADVPTPSQVQAEAIQ